jgi:hypothetical protein
MESNLEKKRMIMKKKNFCVRATLTVALILFAVSGLQAQVHIGDNNEPITGGALLDLTSATAQLGVLPLGVSIDDITKIPASFTERGGDSPATDLRGLLVYNTNTTLGEGLYVWDGAKWYKVMACTGSPTVAALSAPTVCAGSSLQVTANVTSDNGSPVTGYEWKLGGTTIGTSASLNYAVASADNSKALTLSVTNLCGTTTTAGVTLTVPAAFTQANPAAVTICYNATTTFSPAAATGGSGTLTYQWQESTNNSTWTNISGATAAAYTTAALTANRYYRRAATRTTCGGTIYSTSALVTVTANFTQANPAAVTIATGTTTTFNLAAATGGSGTLTYNWQQSTDGSTWENASGTRTNATYTTPALTSRMYYRRQAARSACGGTITSASASVSIGLTLSVCGGSWIRKGVTSAADCTGTLPSSSCVRSIAAAVWGEVWINTAGAAWKWEENVGSYRTTPERAECWVSL